MSSCADIRKSKSTFSPGFIFIVFFIATTGSVTNPHLLENGVELTITDGIPKFPLTFSLSFEISNSLSTITSPSVENLTNILISFSSLPLFLLLTFKIFSSSS